MKDPVPIQSNASHRPNEIISNSVPFVLPCECRRICTLDLTKITDIKTFYEINNAIMKWGQAKHAMGFMDNLYRLLKRDWEENDEWVMTAERAKESWKDIVVLGGIKTNCL